MTLVPRHVSEGPLACAAVVLLAVEDLCLSRPKAVEKWVNGRLQYVTCAQPAALPDTRACFAQKDPASVSVFCIGLCDRHLSHKYLRGKRLNYKAN